MGRNYRTPTGGCLKRLTIKAFQEILSAMATHNSKPQVGERTQALKAVPFFTQMNDQELDVIRSLAIEKSYPKNAVVLTEGEIGDSLYMIESGRVKVFIGDEDGRDIILKLLGPGHFFG